MIISKKQKLISENFQELVLSLQEVPFEQQKEIMYQQLMDWKKEQIQVDDITVMGVKLN